MAASADAVFAWHTLPGAFERLTPPWIVARVLQQSGGIRDGAWVVLRVGRWPTALRWKLEHRDYIEGRQFCDVQLSGPFAEWTHTHRVESAGPDASHLTDKIEYRLPVAALARGLLGGYVKRTLNRLFEYRHELMAHEFSGRFPQPPRPAMNVLVSGSSGLVGSALIPLLTTRGMVVRRLVRQRGERGGDDVFWDPQAGHIEREKLEGLDAVIHLAGENIAGGRWTQDQKRKIRESRVEGTRFLAETLAKLDRRPRALICASATGYYGNRGDELVDEDSSPGTGFLADVSQAWEQATEPARQAGIRVVNVRFGVILSAHGGALRKMLLPFRLGLGGRIGSGRQYLSWISIEDAIGAIYQALTDESLSGPVNVVSPEPVTNREFTRTLGKVLHRPTVFPLPAVAARVVMGEMADELLLASTRVRPKRLLAAGYSFRHPELETALRAVLGK